MTEQKYTIRWRSIERVSYPGCVHRHPCTGLHSVARLWHVRGVERKRSRAVSTADMRIDNFLMLIRTFIYQAS
jgi:hypothetical protein